MKTNPCITRWLTLVTLFIFNLQPAIIFAQGTAFTYQGRLNNNDSPASGTYNLTFSLFITNTSGVPIAGPVTNNAVGVTNGLFTVLIDFGPGVFTGATNWLQIGVETNGVNTFTTLAPRQQLTPTPYAVFANTASGLSGTLPVSQVSGVVPLTQLPVAVMTNYATSVSLAGFFTGSFGGSFYGNGGGLTGLNPANFSAGTAAINISGSAATVMNVANQNWFNVKNFGAKGDGSTDDTAAFTNALLAAFNAGGGTVYFPATATTLGYNIQGQIILPNDGVLYVNHNPSGYTFRQPPIRITGDGQNILDNNFASTGFQKGGSTLIVNATNVLAKIVSLGTGSLEIDHVNLVDNSDGNTDFIFDNNSALNVHDVAFYGQRGYSWSQDCIVLGGTNAAIFASTNSSGCFQGYGTTIHNNYADRVRRFCFLRTAADAVWVVDNSVWDSSGGSCCIEILGTTVLSDTGNQIRGNSIEVPNYTYGVKATYAANNDCIGNTFWDGPNNHIADYLMSTSANNNLIIGGVGGTPTHLIDNGTGNKYLFADGNNLLASSTLTANSLTLNYLTAGSPLLVQNVQEGYNLNPIDQWVYSSSYGLYLNQFVAGGNVSWGFGMTNNAIAYPNMLWFYGTGFVGIGTNAPSQQLEVNGSALIDGAITATNFVGNGSGLTGLNPANLSAGTAAINISGSAATANTLTTLASPPPTPSLIVCWGDSLTGAYDCASQAYGNYLSGLLNIPVNIQSFPGASSSIILSNFLAAPNLWGYPTIIWSGRNDFTGTNTVLGDIATMVSDLNSVGNSNYLVMSIINMESETNGSTAYFDITNLNYYLSAIYSNRFFDVREYLVNAANTNLPQDLWTFTNDIPADSLRCSPGDVHLNNAGYFTVANGILQTSFLNQNIYVFSEGKTRSLISETLANPPAIGLITPNSINATSINASTAITVGGGSYNSTLSPGELVLSASNFTNAVMIQSQPRGVSGNGYPVDSWYCSANYGLYLNRYYTTGNMSWGFGMTNNGIGYPNTLWMYGTGFVGIGTNAPSQQLEVNGSALIDGAITATNFVGNGSGLTGLNPANLSAGTAAINISGSAATANTLTSLASPPPTPSLIVCWGDSLTGAYDCASQAYGNYLSGLLNIPVNIQSFPGASSSIILSNFLAAPNLWGYPTIIWSGRNDFTGTNTVLGDIATMVSDLNSVGNSNYLVMSIINMENEYSGSTNPTSGYYFTITNLNHYLSATYPNNFFDVREYLVNAANTNLPQDLWTFTNDIPADSLHCNPSDIHLNNAGYFTVANGILQTSFLNQNIYVLSEGKTRSLISETLANPPVIGSTTPNSINAININATNINATRISANTTIMVNGAGYSSTLSADELIFNSYLVTGVPIIVQSMPVGTSGNGYPVDSWYCNGNYGLYLNRYYTTGNMSWGFGITNNAIGYPNTLWMYGTGFVGIGTNAPSQQLEVNGSALIDGAITATNFVGNGSGLTGLNPANLSAGTAAINISGSAATANTLTSLASPPPTPSLIVCWGDSLTGAYDCASQAYGNYLSGLLNIPVNIQSFPGASSSIILSNFLAAPNLWGYPTIIWSGRNDFTGTNTVLGDIATMVSDLNSVGNSNYLVMSIINMENEYSGSTNPTSGQGDGYYFTITNLNHYLSATYPNNFFDVREYLVNAANTNLPQDLWTFTNDIPADSLRCSPGDVHLNNAGYFTVANGILQTSFLNLNIYVFSEGKTLSLISKTLANPPVIGSTTPNSINAINVNATRISANTTIMVTGAGYSSTLSADELIFNSYLVTGVPIIVQSMPVGVSGNGYPVDSWYCNDNYGLYLNRYYTTGNMSWGFGMTNNAIGYPNTLWMYGTGFVGIGTNAPSQQLEVNGSALIDGAITATNFVGNGSGLTGLNPANLSAGTAAINISGSAATANTLTSLASPPPTPSLIVCWGDSLTGAYDCASQAYGNYLSGLLNIPVNIQSFPGASSSIILSNFLAAPNLWGYPTIIWSGRNDFTGTNTVLGDIATMVSDLNSVGNSNYLVMSIINMENEYSGSTNPTSGQGDGYYFTITNLNHYLSATYPNNFFDVREYLVNAANTNLPQDLWTFTNDIPADSLRCSPGDVHLNNAGYFTVANGILQTSFLNLNKNVVSEGKTRSLIGQALAVPPIIGGITPNSINATSINATSINATNINASTAITVGGIYNSTLSPGELVLSASNFTNAVMIQSQPRGVSGNGYPVDSWYCSANYGLYLNRYYTTGNMSWGFGITNNAIGYPNTLWMYGTGFVGIGTNAPSQQLEVNGNAKIDGTVTATNFVGNGGGLTNVTATALATPQGMALIPAGLFTMGDSLDGESDATPTNITVSAFYMDINLVSYAQWQSVYFWAINHGYGFVYVGAGRAANHPVQTMLWYDSVKWSNARSQQAGLTPVYYTDAGLTQVYTNNIPDAIYPNWAANGYRLPTEAEWEKAARGGLSGQRFPWGNVITENLANYSGNTGYSYDLGPNGYNAAFTNVWPYTSQVGYFAPNGYGLYDMAGNVSEWCWDWYGTPYGQPTNTNPTGPATGGNRVIRGGSWDSSAYFTRCAARNSVTIVAEPAAAYSDLGFRCVRGH